MTMPIDSVANSFKHCKGHGQSSKVSTMKMDGTYIYILNVG